jgi:hypothetical protein
VFCKHGQSACEDIYQNWNIASDGDVEDIHTGVKGSVVTERVVRKLGKLQAMWRETVLDSTL